MVVKKKTELKNNKMRLVSTNKKVIKKENNISPQNNIPTQSKISPQNNILIQNKVPVPLGVKIIAISSLILSGLFLLFIALIIWAISTSTLFFFGGRANPLAFFVFSLVLLGLFSFSAFIHIKLYKGKDWARIVYLVFLGYHIFNSILISANYVAILNLWTIIPFIYLLILSLIFSYLLLNKKVREAFKNN
jgi:hypothetical protein